MPRTTRPATFRYHFTNGHIDLCPDCSAVLQREGEVAGDPREELVTLAGFKRAEPAPLGVPCDTCASLEAYEDGVNASRACSDTAFGSPEEHARWHAVHDTPTLAELEGEDACRCQPEHEVTCRRSAAALEADLAALSY